MSNHQLLSKIITPIILITVTLVVFTTAFTMLQLNDEKAQSVGSFKIQIVAHDRNHIFTAAHNSAISLGYSPPNSIEDNTPFVPHDNLIYTKKNKKMLLFFHATIGWDCYTGFIDVFGDDWVALGREDAQKFEALIKESLRTKAIKMVENDCPSHS